MAEYLVPGDPRLVAAEGRHAILVLCGEDGGFRVLGAAVFAVHDEAVAEFERVPFGLGEDPDTPCFLRVAGARPGRGW